MRRSFDIFLSQPIECADLDAVLQGQPGFERPPDGLGEVRSWHFYPQDPRLTGCAWIYKPTAEALEPGVMEEESRQRIEDLLGVPPSVSVDVVPSIDDPHGKNALHIALLLGQRWPKLVVFSDDHFHTLTECQAFWEAGRGFPWTHY